MQQYIVYGWDGVDELALERRMKARPGHFVRAKQLKADGHFILGGAMLDEQGKMIGSTMVVQFANEEGLQDWLKTEPYVEGKVWEKVDIRAFRVAEV